jgi:hypothetical protein
LAQRPPGWVGELDDHVSELHLLVEQDLGRAQHRQGGQVGLVEQLHPLVARTGGEGLGGQLASRVVLLVVEGHRHLRTADGLDHVAHAEDVHGPLEAALATGVDHQVLAVAAQEEVGDDPVATEALLGPAPRQVRHVVRVPPPVHGALGHHAVEQGGVDVLALTCQVAGPEGAEDADGGQEGGAVAEVGVAEEGRTGAAARLLGHHAELGCHEAVEARAIAPRTVLAVAGDRAVDRGRLLAVDPVVSEAQPVGHAWAERLHEHVGTGDQRAEPSCALGDREVECHRALAPLPGGARRAVPVGTTARSLHLHHRRPVVGEDHAGHGAGHPPAGVDGHQAFERTRHLRSSLQL